jgi:hypothetical protein
MQTTRWAASLCALTILPVVGPAAWAQQASPNGSAGKPPGAHYNASWPVVLTPAPASAPSGQAAAWSQQEIEDGRARCAALLKGLDLVAVPSDPIRQGGECGSPAPMQLVSIGSSPPVAFSPPAMLTCDMIVALHKWLQRDVQPLARKHLGAPVVGIRVMSSYSCRNAYSRARTRLSEHGRVNALDFGELLTAQGETAQVIADWGPVARESAAKATAERAEAVKRQAEAAAAARKAKAADEPRPRIAAPSAPKVLQGATVPIGIPGLSEPSGSSTSFGWGPPSRLGGPKQADVAPLIPLNGKTTFLRAIHKAACTIFSTVLGPEANSAHRNHFHLDMAQRQSANICE